MSVAKMRQSPNTQNKRAEYSFFVEPFSENVVGGKGQLEII